MNLDRAGQLVLALLLGLAAPAVAAEGVLLQPQFTPGETLRYRMHLTVETESALSPLGSAQGREEPLRLSFDITWQVETLAVEPGGAAQLRAVIEALTVESSRPLEGAPDTSSFVEKPVTYRLLPEGRVEDIVAPAEWLEDDQPAPWLQNWLEQSSGTGDVPARPLAPGETWKSEREVDSPGLPRQRLASESEYLRDEQHEGGACAAILTRFELKGADRREEKLGEAVTSVISRTVEGGGTRLSCYQHASGRLLESSQDSREQIRIEIRELAKDAAGARPPVILTATTTTESHLRQVDLP